MTHETIVQLRPSSFADAPIIEGAADIAMMARPFLRHGELAASCFAWDTGVSGLRLANSRGSIDVLPFQGQQVWDAAFDGRTLTMKSMIDRPHATSDYLANYGGFVIHCGVTAMGVPGPTDTHPLHGELPNASYPLASLAAGIDERGEYLAVSGEYRHAVAFKHRYAARPRVTLRAKSAVVEVSLEVENLKRTPMEIMYLAHVNFRPLDGGRLVYSAPCGPRSVRVRTAIPSHIKPPAGHVEFLQELARDPVKHNILAPGLAFDPEVVLYLDYRGDREGWAHSMMVHPDGFASYIRHRPGQLDHGVRWISRTADQDCIGIVLPATAEPEGYVAEQAKGNVKSLDGGGRIRWDLAAGLLAPAEAREMETTITAILAQG